MMTPGTAVVIVLLIAVVCAVSAYLYRQKKSGAGTCSCGGDCSKCGHCR